MTHSEKVLELLSDGKPHTHHEGYQLNVMLHSRVADLRKKGYEIECWREGDNYLYQMVRTGEQTGGGHSAAPLCGPIRADASHPTAGEADGSPLASPAAPKQLTVWQAA